MRLTVTFVLVSTDLRVKSSIFLLHCTNGQVLTLSERRFKRLCFHSFEDAAMEYIELNDYEVHVYRPVLRDRTDPLTSYTDEEFRSRFRMYKQSFLHLVAIVNIPTTPNRIGNTIPPVLQLLIALLFYADGTFMRETGDCLNISRSSVSRIIHRITRVICLMRPEFISFPTEESATAMKRKFYETAHFPGKHVKNMN